MNDLIQPPKSYGEKQLVSLVHAKYEGEAFARLAQVRNATGYGSKIRTADAMVMSLWPSRGIWLAGFEMKSSRSDWLAELKQPAKAEEIGRWCHYWWLVVSNENVVRGDELPVTWGLMMPDASGKKLLVVKEAVRNDPPAIGFDFLASIFRNITGGMMPVADMERQIREQVESRSADRDMRAEREVERKALETNRTIQSELANLQYKVRQFERQTGIKIDSDEARNWSWTSDALTRHRMELQRLQASAARISQVIQEQLAMPVAKDAIIEYLTPKTEHQP